MDSITQFVLGVGVGLAVSPIKTRRIALISGAIATLPDLDIFIRQSDVLLSTIKHRGFSHSLFFLAFLSFPLAALIQKYCSKTLLDYRQWFWLCFWVLITHPLLDSLTIYGTQLFWPLPAPGVMIGSMFIFDLFYTLPLLISFIILMRRKTIPSWAGISLNTLALTLSSSYLILSLVLQNFVQHAHRPPLDADKIINQYVTPTPTNLLIWQSVFIDKTHSYESYYNLLTGGSKWLILPLNKDKLKAEDSKSIAQYDYFSHGFYQLLEQGDELVLRDIRMGRTDMAIFGFVVAKKHQGIWQAVIPTNKPLKSFSFKRMFGW
ncbi:metal-dependent hydrolase [Candidatus Thioglobus sp.]|uniref:metal-dependent hydrolase n=1 Tax=Candidatus Thioglobus sp. TaxID=2026721 RepID=UPI003D1479DC